MITIIIGTRLTRNSRALKKNHSDYINMDFEYLFGFLEFFCSITGYCLNWVYIPHFKLELPIEYLNFTLKYRNVTTNNCVFL